MISYRKLAMRVLGHPLRVPTNTPRPASHRVTALALTAAMVAGMAAPAYADTYYIGDGSITITKDESGTHVQQGGTTKIDTDDEITIKGGNRPKDTTDPVSNSSKSSTSANSPVQSASATPQSEDNSDPKEMVYLDDKKADPNGSDSSEGGSEGNETDSTEKNQTGTTTGGEGNAPQTNDTTGSGDTSGSEVNSSGSEGDTTGNEENDPQPGGTPTSGNEENDPQPGDSSAPESQFMYASANDDNEPQTESTTTLKTAAENFTKNVIRIINNLVSNSGKDNTLNVTLDNVNIMANNDAALSVEGAGNTKITLKGDNTLTSGGSHAGLEHNEESTGTTGKLTITSGTDDKGDNTGSLTATGGSGAAGIGSSNGKGAGTIEITGGDIKATGGTGGAGIGGGEESTGATKIDITGAALVYAHGSGGAAIGSGESSTGETTITIHDTNTGKGVKSAFASDGAGIGSGRYASGKTHITIRNASVSTLNYSAASTNTSGAGIGTGYASQSNADITIKGSTVKAVGGSGAAIGSGSEGDVFSPPTGEPDAFKTIICITDSNVTASSGPSAAIGSGSYSTNATDIEISGGKIEASNYSGSAIGSGVSAKGKTGISITGSNVTATASRGTGIGSGDSSSGETTIDISGGTVTATGGGDGYDGSAGIGAGMSSTGNTHITLRDRVTVTATGGGDSSLGGGGGAGIGSGSAAKGHTDILIKGATKVTATGGSTAAGIGSGHYVGYSKTGPVGSTTITIRNSADGTVIPIITAKGGGVENKSCGSSGAGIGAGGNTLNKTTINIEGGIITATGGVSLDSRNHSDKRLSGAGIGSGSNVSGETEINIKGGTITEATGGKYGGAGIGSGSYSDTAADNEKGAVTINITGGTIEKAEGGGDYVSSSERWYSGAGIGAGLKAGTTTINIKDNARIASAKGGEYGGAGIGGGYSGHPSNITITGGTITATGTSDAPAIGNGIVSISNAAAPLDITATASDADNAIRSRDDKKLDEIIHLEENDKLGLVKLVKSSTTSISRLFHNGVYTKSIYPAVSETHPLGEWHTEEPTCTEPGKKWRSCTVDNCVVTETEKLPALGHQWGGWTPVEGGSREYRICEVCNEVEYRDVSHNSGISDSSSGDSTISTGLHVLDPAQADILQNIQLVRLNQIIDVLYIDVSHETASLQGVLSDLIGLRSENIETIVFSTERCTSTLSLSDVAALGAGDTPFTLSHSGSTATFTVGGADHSALLR